MDFAQVQTLLREPNGGGGPPKKPLIVLIVGTYILMKTVQNVYSR